MPRRSYLKPLFLVGAMLCAGVAAGLLRRPPVRSSRVLLKPAQLLADGYSRAELTIEGAGKPPDPAISIAGDARGVQLTPLAGGEFIRRWQVRAGVLPGKIALRVESTGHPLSVAVLQLNPQVSDAATDGTPDFLRLEDELDRQAFRRWFTFLTEVQYFVPPANRPVEIVDCSSLIRYGYREALRKHDANWTAAAMLPLVPSMDSVAKYGYPHTPLGANLFRVRAGPYLPADLASGAFTQFAGVETLWKFNSYLVSRNLAGAQPGDLLFFRRQDEPATYHSMIFIGKSQIDSSAGPYVVYHTGPNGKSPGEIKRLSVDQLLHYPDPQWQAIATNSQFLGVFRWNILKVVS